MKLSLVVVILNSGYVDEIMNVVKPIGVRGGTVISGNGSVSDDASKLYGITIHPEKDCMLIIINTKFKNEVIKAIYLYSKQKSLDAIAFTMPITNATSNLINQYKKIEE